MRAHTRIFLILPIVACVGLLWWALGRDVEAQGLEPVLVDESGREPGDSDLAPVPVVTGARASEVGATDSTEPTRVGIAWAEEPRIPGTGWVRLVDATSGEAIAGAEVVFRVPPAAHGRFYAVPGFRPSSLPEEAEVTRTVGSDFEGLVRVLTGSAVMHGQVSAEGYGPAWFVSSVAGPSPSQATRVALGRAASLSMVTVDIDGRPVRGVNVRLSAHFYHLVKRSYGFVSGPKFVRLAITDEHGRCLLENLPSDVPFELTLHAPSGPSRRETRPLVLAAGEERTEHRVLGSGTRLTGRVRDEAGHTVAERQVVLKVAWASHDTIFRRHEQIARETRTDEEGGFVFEDVPDGEWWVAPKSEDGPTLARWIDLSPGERAHNLELVVWTGDTSIAGRVRLATTGEGIPAWISLLALDGPAVGRPFRQRAQPDGGFVIGPLPPGTYELSASDSGASAHTEGKLVVRAGDSEVAVDLFPMGRIAGQVVDSTGAQIAVESFWIFGSERTGVTRGLSGPGATFDLAGLPADTYSLVAVAGDGRVALARGVELSRGSVIENLELEVQAGAFLFLRWEGASRTASYSIYMDDQLVASDGVPQGTEVVEVLPAGRYRIVMDKRGSQGSEREVVLESGQDLHLIFPR